MNQETANREMGKRGIFRRARKSLQIPYYTHTDGKGGILSRPVTASLDCFADFIEVTFGRRDKPTQWGDHRQQAKGCALCPVKLYCHRTAWERITSTPELVQLHQAWDDSTATLSPEERYRDPTWAQLVRAYDARKWHDCNDLALIELEESRTENGRQHRATRAAEKRKGSKKRPRPVSSEIVQKIIEYRDERALDLTVAKLAPNSPLWIRNRTSERCIMIADAWQGREMLRESGAKASGREVAEWLEKHGRRPPDAKKRWVKLVEEALRKVDQLLADGEWPEFEPQAEALRQAGHGMHAAAIIQVLEA